MSAQSPRQPAVPSRVPLFIRYKVPHIYLLKGVWEVRCDPPFYHTELIAAMQFCHELNSKIIRERTTK